MVKIETTEECHSGAKSKGEAIESPVGLERNGSPDGHRGMTVQKRRLEMKSGVQVLNNFMRAAFVAFVILMVIWSVIWFMRMNHHKTPAQAPTEETSVTEAEATAAVEKPVEVKSQGSGVSIPDPDNCFRMNDDETIIACLDRLEEDVIARRKRACLRLKCAFDGMPKVVGKQLTAEMPESCQPFLPPESTRKRGVTGAAAPSRGKASLSAGLQDKGGASAESQGEPEQKEETQ